MARALFSKEFHDRMTPRSAMLEKSFDFRRKGSRAIINADICIGPDWLSVANINAQLPEMPNNLPDESPILHFEEDTGDEPGE